MIKTRTDLINFLIKENNYINYLEIGVRNPHDNFNKVFISHKDGVDPCYESPHSPEINYPITSDSFFELIDGHDIKYDIIFIDGLHLWEQVDKDISNSLKHLSPKGTIVLHDCNPIKEEHQIRHFVQGAHWNGDVWKAILKHRINTPNIKIQTIDTDEGLGVIRFGNEEKYNNSELNTSESYDNLEFSFLEKDRKNILNLVSPEEFINNYKC